MVKKTVLLFSIFWLLISCCNYKPLFNHKALNKIRANNSLDVATYSKIDTTIVYEYIYSISRDGRYKHLHSSKEYGRNFIKFYSNGLTRLFKGIGYDERGLRIIDNYKLSRKDFNPKNRIDGILYTKKGVTKLKKYTILDCSARLVKYNISIKSDTLILTENQPLLYINGMQYVYAKRKIPKEYLEGWYLDN